MAGTEIPAGLRVGSYNIGQGVRDHEIISKVYKDEQAGYDDKINQIASTLNSEYSNYRIEFDGLDKDIPENHQRLRQLDNNITEIKGKAQVQYQANIEVDTVGALSGQLDVICFQEWARVDRVAKEVLEKAGFEIVVGPTKDDECKRPSTAMAYRKGVLSNVQVVSMTSSAPSQENSIYGKQIAAITATYQGVKLLIGSLHSPGFQLYSERQQKSWNDLDHTAQVFADSYFNDAINLAKEQSADVSIFLGDLNNNPENYPGSFDLMENTGFKLKRPPKGEITNINCWDQEYTERQIDMGFVKERPSSGFSPLRYLSKAASFVIGFFFSMKHKKVKVSDMQVMGAFDFKMELNCSDHKPIHCVLTVEEATKPSMISRLWNGCFAARKS